MRIRTWARIRDGLTRFHRAVTPPPARYRWAILLGATALTLGVAWMDNRIPILARLDALYLLLVGGTAWLTGPWGAAALANIILLFGFLPELFAHPAEVSDATLLWNIFGSYTLYVTAAFLLSALRRSWLAEQEAARTDILTGLINRRAFNERLAQEIERVRRYGTDFVVAYLDLDAFKGVNDRFGHETGDAVLRVVADVFRQHLRVSDVAARLGGDEFALLLPETDPEGARVMVERIVGRMVERWRQAGWDEVDVSAGVEPVDATVDGVDAVLSRADALMYRAKVDGKGRVAVGTHP